MQNNAVKDATQIALIKQSAKIVDECYDRLLKAVKAGVTEKELADVVENTMLSLGADGLSFDTIVAFGENGAEPHHVPTSRALKAGDMVTVDMGAKLNGWCSDFTRTFAFGTPCEQMKEIYDIVEEAQKLGLQAVEAGVSCFDVDKVCRDCIEINGYGDDFVHGTGHGVGLLIHEAPTLNRKSEEILENGMVVTVEPGIYVKHLGGVRIEDMVIVGENAPLSRHTRHLLILN